MIEKQNNEIVIIGYSGHSFGCIEILLKKGFTVVGYHDIEEKVYNPYNINYLGNEVNLNNNHIPFITIGDNFVRERIYRNLKETNVLLNTILVHPNAEVSKNSTIKEQTYISSGVIINPQANIGIGCIINTGAIIEHGCSIGNFSHVAPGAVLTGNVSIGKNSFIGANAVIKQGVSIGENSIIGAGAVVLEDVNSNVTMVGNPAKKLR